MYRTNSKATGNSEREETHPHHHVRNFGIPLHGKSDVHPNRVQMHVFEIHHAHGIRHVDVGVFKRKTSETWLQKQSVFLVAAVGVWT